MSVNKLSLKRIEIRWHGRGGQGAITASMILAEGAIYQGKYAQAYPEFGAERRGTPTRAYTRISDEPIYSRAPIIHPDVVVVLDPTLDKSLYMGGLKSNGILVMNTKRSAKEVRDIIGREDIRIVRVDATRIALEILKTPIVNMAMIGALLKSVPVVDMHYVEEAIKENFRPKVAEANILAMKRAFEEAEII